MITETILVTGPTGALGGQMVGTLLQQTTADIIGLVRAPSVEDGMARLVEAVLPFADEAIIKKRVRPLCGDVRNPPWHQDEALREKLIAEVTEIFHLAASTDLAGDFDKLQAVNVGGTSAMLALAQAIHDGGHLRNFAHFSTAFVVGSRNGRRALEEYPIKEPAWANAYEETKYRSEGLVHEAIKEGLPAMVFRPSIVVGDSETGRIENRGIFYHTVRKLGRSGLGVVPGAAEDHIHLVPIDFVCNAALAIARQPASRGKLFHLVSDQPPSLGTLLNVGGRTFDWIGKLRPVPMDKVRKLAESMSQVAEFVPAMGYFSSSLRFDTSNTRSALAGTDIDMPDTGEDYVHKLVLHSKLTGYLR